MNRIGRIAIGGIIESTATSVPSVAPTSGSSPMREAEGEADQRRDAEPQRRAAAGSPRYRSTAR